MVGGLILGYLFVKAIIEYSKTDQSYSGSALFGVAIPVVLGIGLLLLGVVLTCCGASAGTSGSSGADARSSIRTWPPAPARRRGGSGGGGLMGAIVLGYDASPGAKRALDTALDLATHFGDRLVIAFGAAAPPGPPTEEATRTTTRSRSWARA